MTFNCTGLKNTLEQLKILVEELNNTASRPNVIALQECYRDRSFLMKKLKIEGYTPVVASAGMPTKQGVRRGSVILTDRYLVATPLKERSHLWQTPPKSETITELIGIKIIGNSNNTYPQPIELWSAYSGPTRPEAAIFTSILEELAQTRTERVLLVGDMNSRYQPPRLTPGSTRLSRDPCKTIVDKLTYWEEEGNANILNEYGVSTTVNETTIDLAVTMGDWEEGFAHPAYIDLNSTHYPVLVGVLTGYEETTTQKYAEIPNILKESAETIARRCRELNAHANDHNQDTMAQAALAIFKSAKSTGKKRKSRRHWWNEELRGKFANKQAHLAKHGSDAKFRELNQDLQEKISEEKNASFREFASGLDHKNRSRDVFRAIRTIGIRQPAKITQLAV